MTSEEQLAAVKERLSIADNYHDDVISALISDVKGFLISGGVSADIIDTETTIGCIARGVADMWNMGAGDGKFSEIFKLRAYQLSLGA